MKFKQRMIQPVLCSSVLALFGYLAVAQSTHAAPQGGQIVGGSGNITQNNLTTHIKQNTQNLAIDWHSYNLNSNEIVNYLQPNSSSIALNRIIGGSASQIHGQINANGHVVLVNPNGVFFGQGATVNVGGLIASGLDIGTDDFMNGNYLFNGVEGTEGFVINQGLINASLGGNVGLLGKQVSNEGIISARLGSVVMAAGKEAVLTFDNDGLIGIQVTSAILQDDIGVDPAVLNSGEINAEGGRVLLTGSVSQDVFSHAVNHDGIEQATSVVVHEDGSFTLGVGADVENSGTIHVSANQSSDAGTAVLLGENIKNSGQIHADSEQGQAGFIELHAHDTTELTDDARITAQASQSGSGGQVQILGDKVGLFDQSEVNADGVNGGGEILVGGDQQGGNDHIRNAGFIYLGEDTRVSASATDDGDGGTVITYAGDSARIHGQLSATGGLNGGDGGFVETSGKLGFEILSTPNISAAAGAGGAWLIDPNNITIVAGGGNVDINAANPFGTLDDGAQLGVDLIVDALALADGVTVTVTTLDLDANNDSSPTPGVGTEPGNITLLADFDYDGIGTGDTLSLYAEGDITIGDTFGIGENIGEINPTNNDSLSLNLFANGAVSVGSGAGIDTQGGDFTVAGWVSGATTHTVDSFSNSGTIDTTGLAGDGSDDGNIAITTAQTGDFTIRGMTVGDGDLSITTGGNIGLASTNTADALQVGGTTTLVTSTSSGSITLDNWDNDFATISLVGNGVVVYDTNDIDLGDTTIGNSTDAGVLDLRIEEGISDSGTITVFGSASFGAAEQDDASIVLDSTGNNFSGDVDIIDRWGNSGGFELFDVTIVDNSSLTIPTSGISVTNNLSITAGGDINQSASSGNELVVGGTASFNATSGTITLANSGNDFSGTVSLTNTGGGAVQITDANAIQLGASSISGDLTVTAINGDITDIGDPTAGDVADRQTSLVVQGTTAFNANQDGASIVLDGTGSNYVGDVTFTSGGTLNDVTIVDGSGFTLQSSGLTTGGGLSITANGDITQSAASGGELIVGGDAFFDAGNGAITLNNPDNDFIVVSLNNADGSAVQIRDTDAIRFDTSVIGGSLTVVANGGIRQNGALDIAGTSDFTSSNGVIVLDNVANDFQQAVSLATLDNDNVTVVDQNGIVLGTLDISRDLAVTAGDGTITSTGAIDVGRNASFIANASTGTSSIQVDNAANDFTGTVSLAGTNLVSVSIHDVSALALPGLTLTDLTVSSDASITQGTGSGDELVISGSSSFTAADGITLTNVLNNFGGAVSLTNSNAAETVAITNSTAMVLGASSIDGDLVLVSGGDITDLGDAGSAADITVDGTTSLQTVAGAAIVLDSPGSNYGGDVTVVFDGAQANLSTITIDDNSGFVIQAVDTSDNAIGLVLSGALTVIADGDITQGSALDVTGTASFDAGNGAITLMGNGNLFGNTVTLNNSGTDLVQIRDGNALDLGASVIGGGLQVTANGAISQSGALDIGGASGFDAGANTITLTNNSNDFGAAVSLNNSGANNVAIVDSDAIDLGTSSVGGDLTVTAVTGDITDSGDADSSADIVVVGNATFNADAAGASIVLDSTDSDYQGSIGFNSIGGLANVTIDNDSALNFDALSLSGSLQAVSGGGITQNGALVIAQTASFDAGANSIVLDHTGNDFQGAVALTTTGSGNSASLFDSNAVELGRVDVNGNLGVTANSGNITDSDVITVDGTATYTANVTAGASSILLDVAGSNYGGDVTFGGTNLQNVTVVDSSDLQIQALTLTGNLDVTSDGALTQGGALNIGGTASFDAGNGSIDLSNAGNVFGDTVSLANTGANAVAITDSTALVLDALSIDGSLTANSGGAVTQVGALTVAGLADFNAAGHDVTLSNAANDFNSIGVDGVNVSVVDVDDIDLAASVVTGVLSVESVGGSISDSGTLDVSGNAIFTANTAGSSIVLDSAGNRFGGSVSFISSGGLANVSIVDTSALELQALNLTGDLLASSGGALTQTGALTVGGIATFNVAGNNIVLTHATNDFNTVRLTGADVSVVDANTVDLGASTVSGMLSVESISGDITDSGDIVVTGNAAFIANTAGSSIVLDSTGSSYGGNVNFISSGGLANVSIFDTTALDLHGLNLTGDLSATSGGDLTQSGVLIVGGNADFQAGIGNIILDNNSNDFNTVTLSGANVDVVDANDINLGALSASGTMNITTVDGNITDSGDITVIGDAVFTANAPLAGGSSSIVLDSAGSNYGGSVSLLGTNLASVTIVDNSPLELGNLNLSGNLSATSDGNLTQSGVLIVGGNADFQAGTGNIILTNIGNDFNTVTLSGANVAVADVNDINLGALSASGTMNVTTDNGNITDSGDITVTGDAVFIANAPGGSSSIVLDSAGSNYDGSVSLLGANLASVTIVDNSPLELGDLDLSGNLSATSNGNLTQSGVLIVGGNADFQAGTGNIILGNNSNNFNTITLSGANVNVVDANDINLGALTATGTMAVETVNGNITDSGNISVGLNAVFTANAPGGSSSIVLDSAGSNYDGSVSLLGTNLANVTIVDNSPLELGNLSLSGNLSATSAGALTQSGALIVGGNADFQAGTGNIILTNIGNDFNTVTLSGANVDVVDANDINLGALTATGTMAVTTMDGNITDSGNIDVTGDAVFTANAPGGSSSIVLDSADSNYAGSVSLLGTNLANVTIVDNSPLELGNLNLSGNLSATSAGALTQSGVLIVGGNADFQAGSGNIILSNNSNNFNTITLSGANVSVVDANDINLGALTATGTMAVTTMDGSITDSGNIDVTGDAVFTANAPGGSSSIVLDSAGSNYDGSVSLLGTNLANVTIVDNSPLELGNLNLSGNLSATSNGALTQSGALVVGGNADFIATGSDVTLLAMANDFNVITVDAVNVSIFDSNDLTLGAFGITGNLNVTASGDGDITQSGALNVGGLASFTAADDDVVLTEALNQFGTMQVTAGNATISDVDGLLLAASTVATNLTVTANGAGDIGQSGALTVGGLASFSAVDDDIVLDDNLNQFGSVQVTADNATINDVDGLLLAASTVATNLTVTANGAGDIGQSGVLTVGGLAAFIAADDDIVLDDNLNQFGSVQVTADNATVADADGLLLGASTVTTNLTVTANGAGDITQNGALSVGGLASFTAADDNIVLGDNLNQFGSVQVTADNAVIADADGLLLAASTVTTNLTVTANGGGDIGQSGALTVGGLATFVATDDDIVLDDSLNQFGSVRVTADNAAIADADGLLLAASTVTTNLTVTANGAGDITQNGVLSVGGLATFNAVDDDIVLDNGLNEFGAIAVNADNATIMDADGLIMDASVLTGSLGVEVVGPGDITQVGALQVGGDARFETNGGQVIDLDNSANQFQGSFSVASNSAQPLLNVSVSNNGDLELGAITVSNHLNVDANGAITNTGVLYSGGVAGFDAHGHSLTLDNPANDFNHLVIVNAASASIVESNGVQIGSGIAGSGFMNVSSYVAGDLDITAAGAITDENTVELTVGGVASLNSGVDDIELDSLLNDFSSVNIVRAGSVLLHDVNGIDLQSGQISGSLTVRTGGDITNVNGSLNVAGVANFMAGPSDSINLGFDGNSFGDLVTFTASSGTLYDITLVNLEATTLAGLEVSNNLDVESGGAIRQNTAFEVGNLARFEAGNANIVLDADNQFNGLEITSAGHATINNVSDSLTIRGAELSSGLDINAVRLSQSGNVNSQSGDIGITLTAGFDMDPGTSLTTQSGDINVDAVNGAYVASLSAANGNIDFSTGGAITDGNGGGTNFHAQNLTIRAVDGIGSGSEMIDTRAGTMDVVNSDRGNINLNQIGEVRLTALQTDGNITFESDRDIYFSSGSTVSAGTGQLNMQTRSGSFLGLGSADLTNPDIVAQDAVFIGQSGTFGRPGRFLVLSVPGTVLIQTRGTFNPQFIGKFPDSYISEGIDFSVISSLSSLAAEQLVEIETLSDIDPAIFTELRNFAFEDVSIRMPRDQLYEDELDEQDRQEL